MADRVEAIVHDVGQTLAAGSVAGVNAVKEIDAAVSGHDGATGASAGDHPPFEPDLASEHRAKLLEEHQKFAGLGIVPPRGRPPCGMEPEFGMGTLDRAGAG